MSANPARLKFWGVRGSTPTVDRATRRYGGNTPCVEFTGPDGIRVILDCGTGLRMLGKDLAGRENDNVEAHIFVTHYHWDHIQGLPFFTPFYRAQNRFHFYSFRSEFLGHDSLKRVLEAQMAHPYFPVNLSAMTARREFTEVDGETRLQLGETLMTSRWLNHPQGCLGFRLETPAGTIVYATDNEPGDVKLDRNLRELAAGADVFIQDAHYTPEQFAAHRGWGHSSWPDAVCAAREAGARHLVLFHHDPDSSDKVVDGILGDARREFENTWAAAESMLITLDQNRVEVKMPSLDEGLQREANLRAKVLGMTADGRNFEEDTVVRDISLDGAVLWLGHSPRLQSEIQVALESHNGTAGAKYFALRGHVVRIESQSQQGRFGVRVVFTE